MSGTVPSTELEGVRVGDTTISEAEIAREMQHHRADGMRHAHDEAARALVVRELLRLEIKRLALGEVAQACDGETHEEACVRILIEREVHVAQADEAACRQYFASNRGRLRRPDRVLVRHILLAAPPADLQAREGARDLGEELISVLREAPERFAELAQCHSACPSREAGGELGWIERGDTTPEFERQVLLLKAGLAGLTVESRWGHHVVWVDAVERGQPLDYAEAAPKIAAYLETQNRQHAIHHFVQGLTQCYPVQGFDYSTGTS